MVKYYLTVLEDNLDELLQALYVFAFGSILGVFGSFDVLPILGSGPVFGLTEQFIAVGDPAVDGTIVTWAGALSIMAGAVIFLTNLGIEALREKPAEYEWLDFALALGVVGLPAVAVTDVFNLYSDYVAGSAPVSGGLFALAVLGVFFLADADKN